MFILFIELDTLYQLSATGLATTPYINDNCYHWVNVITVKLGYNKLGYNELGYNELGNSELPVIMNKFLSPKSMCNTINYPGYNELPVIRNKFCRPKWFVKTEFYCTLKVITLSNFHFSQFLLNKNKIKFMALIGCLIIDRSSDKNTFLLKF